MNRTLKTLLLWLLIAVLPLNAVGAAMGMSCSAVRDRTAATASVHSAGHQESSIAASEHPATGDHAALHEDGLDISAQTAVVSDGGHGLGHSTCSACSAFCVGAVAPPPTVIPSPTPNGAEIVLISLTPLVVGFIPDGHKRPPRHPSA